MEERHLGAGAERLRLIARYRQGTHIAVLLRK